MQRSFLVTPIYPIATVACAIACTVLSAVGLMLGSWYVRRFASKVASQWLLLLTTVVVSLDCLFSGRVESKGDLLVLSFSSAIGGRLDTHANHQSTAQALSKLYHSPGRFWLLILDQRRIIGRLFRGTFDSSDRYLSGFLEGRADLIASRRHTYIHT